MVGRWKFRPEGSNWGDFGPDDQLGRMNLLTPERRLKAIGEVREGIAFALSLPLDYPGGSELISIRKPPRLFAESSDGDPVYNLVVGERVPGRRDVACDDGVVLYTQYSTQWDSLAHVGGRFDADGDGIAEPLYYNGYKAGEDVLGPERGGPYASALGMEHLAATGAQGRGVLVNLHAIYGNEAAAVGYDALMRAIDDQKVTVEVGDFLLLWTGYDDLLLSMNRKPDVEQLRNSCAGLDGADHRLLRWIDSSGVVALCSDNLAVEAAGRGVGGGTPGGSDDVGHPHSFTHLPIHEFCLFKQGINLGELWYLSALAKWLWAHRRSAFLLTAPPLRLPGSVGSPLTPVATV